MTSAPGRCLLLALAGVAVHLAGCGSCRKTQAPAGPVPTAQWRAGILPPEVLEGEPTRGGTFNIRIPTEPAGLNRLHDQMAEGWMVKYTSGTVYECLAELDRTTHPRYDLKPVLAESWVESPDRLTHTVKLRQNVRFHDGQPFTSKDVKAVVDAVMNPDNLTSSMRSYFVDLESWEAPDPFTFVFRWKKPYVLAFRNAAAALPMMPASALAGDFNTLALNRAPIGTGPFKFAGWEAGKAISFTRNSDYWGEPALLDGFTLRLVKDHTVATQLWEQGQFDLMTMIQPAVWRSVEAPQPSNAWAIEGYNRIQFAENIYSWIGWNEKRELFKDRRVRTALAMLFPYEQVERNVDLGLERFITCPYYRDSNSCDPQVKRLPYDPKKAKALLEEAGWKDTNGDGVLDREGTAFKFTFLTNAHSVRSNKLVPLVQESYARVGIEMDVEKVDNAVYVGRMRRHEFDAGSLLWATLDPVQDLFQLFHSSQSVGGSNYVSYSNPEVDRLLEAIRVEFDPEKRAALERNVHRLLYEDQVYNFLTDRPLLDAAKKRVRGLKPSLAWYDLRKVWLAKE